MSTTLTEKMTLYLFVMTARGSPKNGHSSPRGKMIINGVLKMLEAALIE
jgi:hypothetical protein